MQFTRRTALIVTSTMIGTSVLPRFALAQQSRYSYPVEGGEVIFHPVDHASMVVETPSGTIYVDPVGGAEKYADYPAPDMILITHEHGDHFDLPTLEGLPEVRLITNAAVFEMLPEPMQERASAMKNGDLAEVLGISVEAVPAYNTTAERSQYHPKGRDNGYVLTIGGKRFYIAGDTEPTPEMLALTDIEVAFLPMNLPYTMTVEQAAEAVATFKPRTVFPYHHRDSDVDEFARLVEQSKAPTLVVLANWYK